MIVGERVDARANRILISTSFPVSADVFCGTDAMFEAAMIENMKVALTKGGFFSLLEIPSS